MMSNKTALVCMVALMAMILPASFAGGVFTPISDIWANPKAFVGKNVSIMGHYTGWRDAPCSPPVTRSDWVVCDENKKGIYCTGLLPQDEETSESLPYWADLTVLGVVGMAEEGQPYIKVMETKELKQNIEKMYAVSQILFSLTKLQGQTVGLLGVLVKNFSERGERYYTLADPTGAIKLGRLPKLYPKGTVLHIKGRLELGQDSLPVIEDIEIVSAKVLLD